MKNIKKKQWPIPVQSPERVHRNGFTTRMERDKNKGKKNGIPFKRQSIVENIISD